MVYIHCAPWYISMESIYVLAGTVFLMSKELDTEVWSLLAS